MEAKNRLLRLIPVSELLTHNWRNPKFEDYFVYYTSKKHFNLIAHEPADS